MTTTVTHPGWCAESYRCTAPAGGEHRSKPLILARAGRIAVVVNLVQRADRAHTVAELRISIRLRGRTPEHQAAGLVRWLHRLFRLPAPGGSR